MSENFLKCLYITCCIHDPKCNIIGVLSSNQISSLFSLLGLLDVLFITLMNDYHRRRFYVDMHTASEHEDTHIAILWRLPIKKWFIGDIQDDGLIVFLKKIWSVAIITRNIVKSEHGPKRRHQWDWLCACVSFYCFLRYNNLSTTTSPGTNASTCTLQRSVLTRVFSPLNLFHRASPFRIYRKL